MSISPPIQRLATSSSHAPVFCANTAATFPLIEGTSSAAVTSIALNALAQCTNAANSVLHESMERRALSAQIQEPEAATYSAVEVQSRRQELPVEPNLNSGASEALNRIQRYELERESLKALIAEMEAQLQGPQEPVEPNPLMDEIEKRVEAFERETEALILEFSQNSAS